VAGYPEFVRDVEHQLEDLGVAPVGPDSDAVLVARTLRSAGPLHLDELRAQPELHGWSEPRLENAVASAWSRDLVSVNARDKLVAL
jgi:hypothetical protein